MSCFVVVVALLAGGLASACEPQPTLRHQIAMADGKDGGTGIFISFTLANSGDRPLWILTWYTPLEGILNDIFELSCDGRPVDYVGPMVKRGRPAADSFIHLQPGGAIRQVVDLMAAYDLPDTGNCVVSFTRPIEIMETPQPDAVHIDSDRPSLLEIRSFGKPLFFRIDKGNRHSRL